MKLSLVIPVFNEEESLLELYRQIEAVALQNNYEIEIVFVDDGSTDGSWKFIETAARLNPIVQGIRFRRNFGKAAALQAGVHAATSDIIITLDADLQDDPAEIPDFLRLMDNNLDVISGWKKDRHDPWHKVFPSHCFNAMVSWLTGVHLHDHNCGMKCYRREIFDEITLYGERHRFIPVLAAARGYKVGEKVIQHRARKFGHSKYGFKRFVKGFLDLITIKFVTGYGTRPQHLLGTWGLIFFTIGALLLSMFAALWLGSRIFCEPEHIIHLSGRPAVIYSAALMLFGGQLFSVGAVAELFIAFQNKKTPEFSIKTKISSVVNLPVSDRQEFDQQTEQESTLQSTADQTSK